MTDLGTDGSCQTKHIIFIVLWYHFDLNLELMSHTERYDFEDCDNMVSVIYSQRLRTCTKSLLVLLFSLYGRNKNMHYRNHSYFNRVSLTLQQIPQSTKIYFWVMNIIVVRSHPCNLKCPLKRYFKWGKNDKLCHRKKNCTIPYM